MSMLAEPAGTVKSVSIVATTVTTPDNQVIVIPNKNVWGNVITNVTASKTRRVDLVFGIGYDDDIPTAINVMQGNGHRTSAGAGRPAADDPSTRTGRQFSELHLPALDPDGRLLDRLLGSDATGERRLRRGRRVHPVPATGCIHAPRCSEAGNGYIAGRYQNRSFTRESAIRRHQRFRSQRRRFRRRPRALINVRAARKNTSRHVTSISAVPLPSRPPCPR